ncbi:hypothetical protein [Rurimicrobium arvi]|uniref:Lipoprotein n=1 Tax=Rurimicrobium arvi TaxID=2049916 RepID=A0ABP8MJS1_9BACT
MSRFPPLKVILFAACVAGLMGCLSIKPGAVKSGKNLYEMFAAKSGGTMYYIKPLEFVSINRKGTLAMDFTFRHADVNKDTVSLKFSAFDAEVIKQMDSVQISNGAQTVTFHNVEHMFSDWGHNEYINRFSIDAPLASVKSLFDAHPWKVTLFRDGKERHYNSVKKTDKNIPKLQKYVFAVL